MKRLSPNQIWFLAVIIVTLATVGLLFSPAAQANDGPPEKGAVPRIDAVAVRLPDQQIFNEDLTVEAGQVIDENVTVFRGNVEIEEGASIIGDLSVFSGNVEIAGTLDGNLAVIGGNVELRNSARVTGDVSVVGGRLQRSSGAFIGGNFVGGPRVPVEDIESRPDVPVRTVESNASRPFILTFVLRLMQAVLWTLLITGLVVLLRWLFPKQLKEIQSTGEEQPALSFTVGLVVSVAALLLGVLLAITICLIPFSLLIWALMAVVTLVGWAVLSVWLGERLEGSLRQRVGTKLHPLIPVAIGALLLTGVTFLAWSLLECLGVFMVILLGSTGTGAVLVHLARRTNLTGGASAGRGPSEGPSGPSPSPAPSPPSGGGVVVTSPTEPDSDIATSPPQTSDAEVVERATGVVEDEDAVIHPPATSDAGFVTGEELGLSEDERQQLREGAGIDTPPDDFMRIRGIGPAFNRRLIEAGVTRYQQLATMTPEQIGEIVGWPPERVLRDRLREQAAELAAQG